MKRIIIFLVFIVVFFGTDKKAVAKEYDLINESTISLELMHNGQDYMKEVSITEDEIIAEYNKYLNMIPERSMYVDEDVNEVFKGFIDYAIANGMIEDTEMARDAITKSLVRMQFSIVVSAGNTLGYTMAATLLSHSLQDSPSVLSYSANSSMANNIGASTECASLIQMFKNAVTGTSRTQYTMSGNISLNSTADLHLAFNDVDYIMMGTKSNGRWTVYITISDTYDFDYVSWQNAMTDSSVVTIINNYAAYAQSIGAIVPYDVHVTISKSF